MIVSYGGEIWRVPVDGTAPTKIPFSVDADVAIGPEVRFDYRSRTRRRSPRTRSAIRSRRPMGAGSRSRCSTGSTSWTCRAARRARLTTQEVGEYFPAWSPDGTSHRLRDVGDRRRPRHEGAASAGGAAGAAHARAGLLPAAGLVAGWQTHRRDPRVRARRRGSRSTPSSSMGWAPSSSGSRRAVATSRSSGRPRPRRVRTSRRSQADLPLRTVAAPDGSHGRRCAPPTVALVSMRWDGTDVKQHVRVTGSCPSPRTTSSRRRSDIVMPRDVDARAREPARHADRRPDPDGAEGRPGARAWPTTTSTWSRCRRPAAAAPLVALASPTAPRCPIRKLTDIGGEFPVWSADGRTVHWSIGNAFVTYGSSARRRWTTACAGPASIRRRAPARPTGRTSSAFA